VFQLRIANFKRKRVNDLVNDLVNDPFSATIRIDLQGL
jgi:hypothetical protein